MYWIIGVLFILIFNITVLLLLLLKFSHAADLYRSLLVSFPANEKFYFVRVAFRALLSIPL